MTLHTAVSTQLTSLYQVTVFLILIVSDILSDISLCSVTKLPKTLFNFFLLFVSVIFVLLVEVIYTMAG